MKSTAIFKAISDSYSKYIITTKSGGNECYIVWGEDATDDRNDKLLLDGVTNVMAFRSLPGIVQYILNPSATLFDELAMQDWADASLDVQPSSSCTYDLDWTLGLISSDRFRHLQNSKREECWDVLNLLHLISDYAYQIDDTYLLSLYRGEPISTFSDYVYDNFFWTIPEEELAVRNNQMIWEPLYPQFIQDVMDLVRTFRSRMIYYS